MGQFINRPLKRFYVKEIIPVFIAPMSARIKQGEKSQKKALKYFGTGYAVISTIKYIGCPVILKLH
jgi:hypothetical protein